MSVRSDEYKPVKLVELGENLEIWKIHVDDLHEQELNPLVEDKKTFEQLINTIKQQRRLESLPLVALEENMFELISGHHRVRAARAAGLQMIPCLVDVTHMSRDKIAAKQLAHNNIHGHIDFDMAMTIFDGIKEVDSQIEAFMDITASQKDKIDSTVKSVTATIDWKSIQFLFLPRSIENMDMLIKSLSKKDDIYVSTIDQYPSFIELMDRCRNKYNIHSTGALVDFLIDTCRDKI